ncbi:hypothetical protein F4679DRAFT_595966 [Xylaria curta]|nr:hypothetical protein F4679DRAFT_595966 [Xylaria curta]
MHCMETVSMPQTLSKRKESYDSLSFQGIIPSNIYNKDWWQGLKEQQLVSYTKRKLTDEFNSLNAIIGLCRPLESSGIRHLYGIPIRKAPKATASCLQLSIAWYHEAAGVRRWQFPS